MDAIDINRTVKRTSGYYFQDGIVEIFSGLVFAAIAALFFVEGFLDPPIPSFSAFSLPVILLVSMLVGRWVIPLFKERVTHPRTGYVEYSRLSGGRRLLVLAIAAGMSVILAAVMMAARGLWPWIPLLNGLTIGSFLLFMAWMLRLSRFHALGCLSAAAGAAASLADLGETIGTACYFGIMGLVLFLSGVMVLRGYLQRAPKQADV